jgi:hypothetical protein
MRRKSSVALFMALAFWIGSAHAQTCTPFTDVAASSAFCSNIQWLYNRGVTTGCTATTFCPAQFVRRDQIAAFLNRLANNLFPLTCVSGQVMKWNGTQWACSNDLTGGGGPTNAFVQGGNAFGTPAVLGTTDFQPIEVRIAGQRVLQLEIPDYPNVVAGSRFNSSGAGQFGQTISGGGTNGTCPSSAGQRPCANVSSASNTTIGGGYANVAAEYAATIAGGAGNSAAGYTASVLGGYQNLAGGSFSVAAGGAFNEASGHNSFAAGWRAKATHKGSFMWADSTEVDFGVPVDNFFGVRATGGVGFTVAVDTHTGLGTQFCDLRPGVMGWVCVSDREVKENFAPANGADVLERLVAMPIHSWNFQGADPGLRNLGPVAQDFHAAFGFGGDDRTIATGNLHGVALAAIQGLNAKLEATVAQQAREIVELKAIVAALVARSRESP